MGFLVSSKEKGSINKRSQIGKRPLILTNKGFALVDKCTNGTVEIDIDFLRLEVFVRSLGFQLKEKTDVHLCDRHAA